MSERLKAEMWDKMQYLFRNYYDRTVHAVLYYDGRIDEDVLKNVLITLTEKAPVLHSGFRENAINPYWKVMPYTIDDILSVADTADLERDINEFICRTIPADNNVQFMVRVLNEGDRSVLCMIVNHMCFDGGDFKYFLKKLALNYNLALKGERATELKSGTRSFTQVYSKLTPEERSVAKRLYKNISRVKDEHRFPLSPPSPDDVNMIVRRRIDAADFERFRLAGKKLEVTVNDLLLTVYVRALYDVVPVPPDEPLTIPCMVDLRRHIEGGENSGGLANHTGFMQCTARRKGETLADTLIEIVNSVNKSKRDKYIGLYSLPLLNLAYTILPFTIAELAIKAGYNNPLIGMSNIGVLPAGELNLGSCAVLDGFMTGAVKYKPFMQLAASTCNNNLTLTVAVRGNEEDREIINRFFDVLCGYVREFIDEHS